MVNRQPRGKILAISTARSLLEKAGQSGKTDPSGIPGHPNTPGNLIRFVRRKPVNTSEYRANERGKRESIASEEASQVFGNILTVGPRFRMTPRYPAWCK